MKQRNAERPRKCKERRMNKIKERLLKCHSSLDAWVGRWDNFLYFFILFEASYLRYDYSQSCAPTQAHYSSCPVDFTKQKWNVRKPPVNS